MDEELDRLKEQIAKAREHGEVTFKMRVAVAGYVTLLGTPGVIGVDVEFPDVDLMHVYPTLFDRRTCGPTTFRLSFGKQLRWVCIRHPWGLKMADVIVPEDD